MRFSPWSYRYADEILNSELAVKKEIKGAIRSIQVQSNGLSRPEIKRRVAGIFEGIPNIQELE